jgi:ectoine hydroxylase-related dioxygenase (phytanoyl-CoA dioxygenase family)
MSRHVSAEDKAQFETHGYVIARGLLTREELAAVDRETARIAAADGEDNGAFYYSEPNAAEPGKKIIRRIERVGAASKVLDSIFRAEKIAGAVSELFGEPAVLFKDKLNLKLPGGGGFKAHVDGHFWWTDARGVTRRGWGEYATSFYNALVSVDAATTENGCLQIASLQDTFAHVGRTFDQIIANVEGRGPDIPARLMASVTMRPIETEPGDVLFFDWRCIHGSDANRSGQQRRILYSTYNKQSEGDHLAAYYEGKRTSAEPLAHKSLGGRTDD